MNILDKCACAWAVSINMNYNVPQCVHLFLQAKYLVLLMYFHLLYYCLNNDYCVLHPCVYNALESYTENNCSTIQVMAKAILNKIQPNLCYIISMTLDEANSLIHMIQFACLLPQYGNSADKAHSILRGFLLNPINYKALCSATEKMMEESNSKETEDLAAELIWIIGTTDTASGTDSELAVHLQMEARTLSEVCRCGK